MCLQPWLASSVAQITNILLPMLSAPCAFSHHFPCDSQVTDFRNDVILAEACRTDVETYCKDTEPGGRKSDLAVTKSDQTVTKSDTVETKSDRNRERLDRDRE